MAEPLAQTGHLLRSHLLLFRKVTDLYLPFHPIREELDLGFDGGLRLSLCQLGRRGG